jgi:transcriptional regulator with XRE-family HTH domain
VTVPVTPEQLAEARRDLGRQLACMREATGLTQDQLARLTGYSRSAIANVETGRGSQPRTSWTRYDQLLHADGALLAGYDHYATLASQHRRQAARERERQRTDKIEQWQADTAPDASPLASSAVIRDPLPTPSTTILQQAVPDWEGGDTNRRHLLTLLTQGLGAVAGRSLFDPATRGSMARPDAVDRRLIASHTEVAEALASMYRTADPRSVLSMAVAYADDLLRLYDEQAAEPSPELTTLVVGIHCQVGLWAYHAGQTVTAYRHLATGCAVAAAAGDRPLQARALGALSYLHSSAPRGGIGGNPRRALGLLTRALELAARADDFTRGWLATWRADQHATLGNLPAALRDVETAGAALDADRDAPERGFFSRHNYGYGMREHLDSVRGLVHTLAGETDQAERTFEHVQTRAANNRRRVATFGHQGLGRARLSDPEAACDALTSSIDLAIADPYPMGIKRTVGVRASFDPNWTKLACVRELDERLQLLGATA